MTTTRHLLLLPALAALALAGCEPASEPTGGGGGAPGTGSIAVQIQWAGQPPAPAPTAAASLRARLVSLVTAPFGGNEPSFRAAAPAGVVKIEASVTGSGIDTPVTGSKDVKPGESGTFEITGVPEGDSRNLDVGGLNMAGTRIWRADPVVVTVVANQSSNAPTITMIPASENYDSGDQTPPAPVTGFTASGSGGSVTLSWTNPSDSDFAGVRIMRRTDNNWPESVVDISDTSTLVYDGSGTSHTDSGLVEGETYAYAAFAYDFSENHSGGLLAVLRTGSGADNDAPGAVTAFTALAGDGSVTLKWGNPTDADLAGVRIVRNALAAPTTPIDGVIVQDAAAATTASDTGLTNGTVYYYAAFAYDGQQPPNYSPSRGASATPVSGQVAAARFGTAVFGQDFWE